MKDWFRLRKLQGYTDGLYDMRKRYPQDESYNLGYAEGIQERLLRGSDDYPDEQIWEPGGGSHTDQRRIP